MSNKQKLELTWIGKEKRPRQAFGQQPAAQLPWFHIVTLLTKLSTDTTREREAP